MKMLTSGYRAAVSQKGVRVEEHDDNLLVWVHLPKPTDGIMDLILLK